MASLMQVNGKEGGVHLPSSNKAECTALLASKMASLMLQVNGKEGGAHLMQVNGKKEGGAHLPSKSKAEDQEELAVMRGGGDDREEEELVRVSPAQIKKAVKEYVRKHGLAPTKTDPSIKDSPYPEVPDFPNAYNTYHLHHGGMPDLKRLRAINIAKTHLYKYRANFMGYQGNQNLHFQKQLGSFLDIHTNNIGDTFTEGSHILNTKFLERAVLDYYAELWHAQYPHIAQQPESYWGFCLTMGSTEGNMYSMWNARDYLAGKRILIDSSLKIVKRKAGSSDQLIVPRLVYHSAPKPVDKLHAYTPIAFFSEDSHYSLSKTMNILNIRTFSAEGQEHYDGLCPLKESQGEWPTEVPSHESGAMDLDALAKLVEFFAAKGYPIIVYFNYGTTFKGAYDDVGNACNKLRPILQKYDLLERKVQYDEDDPSKFDVRTGYWFHVDGALGAACMPYIEMAFDAGLVEQKGPTFDFRLPMVHSISMSGHKWIGAPCPCGVFMTRTKYRMLPPSIPDYVGTPDTTFASSRNGLSPMFLWDYIARTSYEDQIYKAIRLEELAKYAEKRLLYLQEEVVKEDIYVERSPLALTVRFKRANADICLKYTLSNQDISGRRYSHIFTMDHVTTGLIDDLIEDLSKPGAFSEDAPRSIAPITDVTVLAPKTRRLALIPNEGRGFR